MMETMKVKEETKKKIIANCEKYKETVLETFEVDCYFIVKTSDDGDIRYKGFIQYKDRFKKLIYTHKTFDECLVDCVTCKHENTVISHATPYIMKMIGM